MSEQEPSGTMTGVDLHGQIATLTAENDKLKRRVLDLTVTPAGDAPAWRLMQERLDALTADLAAANEWADYNRDLAMQHRELAERAIAAGENIKDQLTAAQAERDELRAELVSIHETVVSGCAMGRNAIGKGYREPMTSKGIRSARRLVELGAWEQHPDTLDVFRPIPTESAEAAARKEGDGDG